MPMTATPSTNGANTTARKKFRPGNLRARGTATSRGSTTISGTLRRVKIAVARIAAQNGPEVTEPGVNSSM
jgi:hypothetical protein